HPCTLRAARLTGPRTIRVPTGAGRRARAAGGRALVGTDAQRLPGHPGGADPCERLRGQLRPDLDEAEGRKDVDLAEVLAAQAALTGDRPDDRLRPHTVGVPVRDAVARARAGPACPRPGCAVIDEPDATRLARPGASRLLGGAGLHLLLAGGAGALVADGQGRHDGEQLLGGDLPGLQVLGDDAAVQVQPPGLAAQLGAREQG